MSKHSLFLQPLFQFDGQGNVVYFPPRWLRRGPRRGYVMEASHRWRRVAAKLAWPVFFVIYLATLSVLRVNPGLLVGAFEILIYAAFSEALACGLVKSDLPYDENSACRDTLRIAGAGWLWADIAFAGAICASSIWMFFAYGLSVAGVLFGMSLANLLWTMHTTRRLWGGASHR